MRNLCHDDCMCHPLCSVGEENLHSDHPQLHSKCQSGHFTVTSIDMLIRFFFLTSTIYVTLHNSLALIDSKKIKLHNSFYSVT